MFAGWFGNSNSGTAAAPSSAASASGASPTSSSTALPAGAHPSDANAARQQRLLETVFQSSIETLLLESSKHRRLAPLREVALMTRQHRYPPMELFHTLVLACELSARGKSTRSVLRQCLLDLGKLASLGLMAVTAPVALSVCDLVRRLALHMHQGTSDAGVVASTDNSGTGTTSAAPAGTKRDGGNGVAVTAEAGGDSAYGRGATPAAAGASHAPAGLSSVVHTTDLLVPDEELLVRLAQLVMAFLSACTLEGQGLRHLLGVLLLLYAGSGVQSMLEATCDVAITQRLVASFQALCVEEEDAINAGHGDEEQSRPPYRLEDHTAEPGPHAARATSSLAPQLRAVSLLKDVCHMAVGKAPRWIDMRLSLHAADGTASVGLIGVAQVRGASPRASLSLPHASQSDDDEETVAPAAAVTSTASTKSQSSLGHSALHPGIAFMDEDDGMALLRAGSQVPTAMAQGKGDEDDAKSVPVALVESHTGAATSSQKAQPPPGSTIGVSTSGSARTDSSLVITVTSVPHRLRVLLMRTLIQFFGSAAEVGRARENKNGHKITTTATTATAVLGSSVNPLLAQCLNEDVVGLALECPHYLDSVFVLQALQEQRVALHQHNREVFARRRRGGGHGAARSRATSLISENAPDGDVGEWNAFHVALVDFTSTDHNVADLQVGGHHTASGGVTNHSGNTSAGAVDAPTSARLVEQAEEQFILSQRLLVMALTRYAPVMRRAASTVLAYHTSIIRESRTSGGTNAQATMIVLTLWRKAMAEEGLLAHLLSIVAAEPVAPPSSPSQAEPATISNTHNNSNNGDPGMAASATRGRQRPVFLSMVLECTAQLNEVLRTAENAVYAREEARRDAQRQEREGATEITRASRTVSAAIASEEATADASCAASTEAPMIPTSITGASTSPPSQPQSAQPQQVLLPSSVRRDVEASRTPVLAPAGVLSPVTSSKPRARPSGSRRRRKIVLTHPAAEYQQDLMGFLTMFGQGFARLVEAAVGTNEKPLPTAAASPAMGLPPLRDAFARLHFSLLTCTALSTRQMTETGDDMIHLTLKAASHWVQVCCLLNLNTERDLYLRALVGAIGGYHPLLAELDDTLCALQDEFDQRLAMENEELAGGSAASPSSAGVRSTSASVHSGPSLTGSGGRHARGGAPGHSAASQLRRWGGQLAQNMRRLTGLDPVAAGAGSQAPPQQQRGAAMMSASTAMETATTNANNYANRASAAVESHHTAAVAPPALLGPITTHTVLVALEQRLASRSAQEAVQEAVRLMQRRLVMMKTLFSLGSTLGESLTADGWSILSEGFALVEWLAQRLELLTRCVRDAALAEEQRRQLNSDLNHLRDALRMLCLDNVSRLQLGTFRVFLMTLLDACVVSPRSSSSTFTVDAPGRQGPWRSPPPALSAADDEDDDGAVDVRAILYPAYLCAPQLSVEDSRCLAWEAQSRSSCFQQWRLVAESLGLVLVSLIPSTVTTSTTAFSSSRKQSGDQTEEEQHKQRLLAQYATIAWEALQSLYQRTAERAHIVFWIQFLMRSPLHAALASGGGGPRHSRGDKPGTSSLASSGAPSGGHGGAYSGSLGSLATGGGGGESHGSTGRAGTRAGTTSSAMMSATSLPPAASAALTDVADAAATGALGLLPTELRALEDVLSGLLEDLVALAAVSAAAGRRPDLLDRLPVSTASTNANPPTASTSAGLDGAAMRDGEAKMAAALSSSTFSSSSFVELVVRLVPYRRVSGPYMPSVAEAGVEGTAADAARREHAWAQDRSPFLCTSRAVRAAAYGHTDVILEGPFALIDELYTNFESWSVASPMRAGASPVVSPLQFPAMRAPFGFGSDATEPVNPLGSGAGAFMVRFGRLTGHLHRLPLVILSTRAAAVLLHGTLQLVQSHSEDLQGSGWVPVIRVLQCTASSASLLGAPQTSAVRGRGGRTAETDAVEEGQATRTRSLSAADGRQEESSQNDGRASEDDDEEEERARAAVVAELWPAILPRLTQHAAEAVSQSFRAVEAIQHDVITSLNWQGLQQLVRCVAAFMRYRVHRSDDVRLHINLSAVQLLWSLADYLAASDLPAAAAEELWCSLLLQLYEGCLDTRQEVRQSALKTFFSIALAHGALFTGDVWRCVLLSVLAPMMGVILESLPSCAIPQPVASPEVSASTPSKTAPVLTAPISHKSAAADAASREKVFQAVAQVLQYADQAQRLRFMTLEEDEEDALDPVVSASSTAAAPTSRTAAARSRTVLGELPVQQSGAMQSLRVPAAQQALIRVFAAAPKQLDEMRISVMDGAARIFLGHADNMTVALARATTMPSVASTSTAPASPSFATIRPVDAREAVAVHGESAALVEAVLSCFIQFCGEASVVVRETSGEDVALAAVHAVHGLMMESPLPGGLSARCVASAWTALKQLILRDPSTQHTAKKQCTANVVAGVVAALCDDVCLQRSLAIESDPQLVLGDQSVAPSSPLLNRNYSSSRLGASAAPSAASPVGAIHATTVEGASGTSSASWRRRAGLSALAAAGSTAAFSDASSHAPPQASVGSSTFPNAGVVHGRGSALCGTRVTVPDRSAADAEASPKRLFQELIAVLKHCVRCEAVTDAYFFPSKVQTTLVEGLQALWPLISAAEGQTMLEAVVLPQFPTAQAVSRYVLQDITTAGPPEKCTAGGEAVGTGGAPISLRRCLPPGAHPNAILLYLEFIRDCLTVPTAANPSAGTSFASRANSTVDFGRDDPLGVAVHKDEESAHVLATMTDNTRTFQRLVGPAVLRAVGHLLGLQYVSPAVVALHDPGTVFNIPDGFFARVYDVLLFVVWEVIQGQSSAAMAASAEMATEAHAPRLAVRRCEAVAALVEVFTHLLALANTVTDHYELGRAAMLPPPSIADGVKTLDQLVTVLGELVDHLVSRCDDVGSAAEVLSALALASSARAIVLSPIAMRSLQILRRYASVAPTTTRIVATAPTSTTIDATATTRSAPDAAFVSASTDAVHARERLGDVVRLSMMSRNRAVMAQYKAKPRSEHAVNMLKDTLDTVREACAATMSKCGLVSAATETVAAAKEAESEQDGVAKRWQQRATTLDTQSLKSMIPDLLMLVSAVDSDPSPRSEEEIQREEAVRTLLARTLEDVFSTLLAMHQV